ncbi:MAG: heavy metal translocating P-type ATPase [Chlamydiales bacterium]
MSKPYLVNCTLCAQEIRNTALSSEEGLPFCCAGCKTVYSILNHLGELEHYRSHPLFKQAKQFGIISDINPINQEKADSKSHVFHLEIEGMWCSSCAHLISLIVKKLEGVITCTVDYTTDLARLEFDPMKISRERILQRIEVLGYTPNILENIEMKPSRSPLFLRTIIAAFCFLNTMMLSYPIYASFFNKDFTSSVETMVWMSFLFSLPVVSYCAYPIYRRCFTSLRYGKFGMETLVSLGACTAFCYSSYQMINGSHHVYFDSLCAMIAFVLIGKTIESRAKRSVKETLFLASRSLPKRGCKRLKDGTIQYLPIKEFTIGDTLIVKSGEKVVLDGVIVEGAGDFDESIMTGETLPQSKSVGNCVLSGAVLIHGWVAICVTQPQSSSTLYHIMEMVADGLQQRNFKTSYGDRITQWFVPIVCLIAIAFCGYGYWIGDSLENTIVGSISILLIACPCAIGIAAPIAEAHVIHQLGKKGLIVRHRESLRHLCDLTTVVFDKTGTLTQAHFIIEKGLEFLTDPERSILKGLALHSQHPLSHCLTQTLSDKPFSITQPCEEPGMGITGYHHDNLYFLGSEKLAKRFHPNENLSSGLYFGSVAKIISKIEMSSPLKLQAPQIVSSFSSLKTVLLSGDTKESVMKVGKECSFDEILWRQSPREKQDYIEKAKEKGEIVAMVGDGINDSPSLSSAHIGISVLQATDLSSQASGMILTHDDLSVISIAWDLAKKGRRIAWQNLAWSFSYNVVGLGLAVFGMLNPLYAAFAMTSSSFLVLGNSARLSWKKAPMLRRAKYVEHKMRADESHYFEGYLK